VFGSVLQCIAVCWSELQCVVFQRVVRIVQHHYPMQCVAVCCTVLQCAAVCCSVLQCAAVC